ncbi:hypothetical protein L3Q72_22300 [Vibrio sp. JC009]|uniref:hypothetical protein n=1 Tax=Vibrio sp. JC009 TaxID=2912314 RepID=UPI0023AFB787|nr:hypothetical protein [Vibrio sp. JC009]WED23965.1 hypothetical protein L3Q72_22300 [Vibrio sp. JC009]
MKIEQCWSHYLKAEELTQQGHWPEAHHLYNKVLIHLPDHIQSAVTCDSTKPCQLLCMLDGFRNASINQSEILNNLGQGDEAFALLNQAYCYIQFLALESNVLLKAIKPSLYRHGEELFRYITAFCTAQRSATWMLELENIQKAHNHFYQLQHQHVFEQPERLN